MRTYKLLSLILVLGIGFSACYDEDAIHTTKGDIPYELKEGGDEVDHIFINFIKKTDPSLWLITIRLITNGT